MTGLICQECGKSEEQSLQNLKRGTEDEYICSACGGALSPPVRYFKPRKCLIDDELTDGLAPWEKVHGEHHLIPCAATTLHGIMEEVERDNPSPFGWIFYVDRWDDSKKIDRSKTQGANDER